MVTNTETPLGEWLKNTCDVPRIVVAVQESYLFSDIADE
jgi:hypothetical protein